MTREWISVIEFLKKDDVTKEQRDKFYFFYQRDYEFHDIERVIVTPDFLWVYDNYNIKAINRAGVCFEASYDNPNKFEYCDEDGNNLETDEPIPQEPS